jgi:hypothetical protein
MQFGWVLLGLACAASGAWVLYRLLVFSKLKYLAAASAAWGTWLIVSLLSDSCAQTSQSWQLDYISTRLALCLDTQAAQVWSLVFCIEFLILLLLTVWRRLFNSYHFVASLRCFIISCGVWFVVSFAMVVEFRNDGHALTHSFLIFTPTKESTLHVYAAVNTMIAFTLLHTSMCISLFALSRYEYVLQTKLAGARAAYVRVVDFDFRKDLNDNRLKSEAGSSGNVGGQVDEAVHSEHWHDYRNVICKYVVLDGIYLVCVVIFLICYIMSTEQDALFRAAVVTEWLVLAVGVCMYVYALWQSERPLSWVKEVREHIFQDAMHNLLSCKRSWLGLFYCVSFVLTLLFTLSIFGMAPLSNSADREHVHTSPMFLLVVLTTFTYAAILMMC